jgi:hypothetical protein
MNAFKGRRAVVERGAPEQHDRHDSSGKIPDNMIGTIRPV